MSYLQDFGGDLLAAGFNILPIKQGHKRPTIKNWATLKADSRMYDTWCRAPWMVEAGVGVLTSETPAIDIDVMDSDVVDRLVGFIDLELGVAPMRVGQPPRVLMVFKTDEPFKKLTSAVYEDELGELNRVEILGHGQQFVAYHTHPTTGRPYLWDNEDLLNVESLNHIDVETAAKVIEEFERLAEERGWRRKHNGHGGGLATSLEELDATKPPVTLSKEQINSQLDMLGDDYGSGYDAWLKVGQALHHQFGGGGDGLELWEQWSMSQPKFIEGECERKWDTFCYIGKNPVTYRTILEDVKAVREDQDYEARQKYKDMIANAATAKELELVVANEIARDQILSDSSRALLVSWFIDAFKRVEGVRLRNNAAVALLKPKFDRDFTEEYPWADKYVFVTSTKQFYVAGSFEALDIAAFNAVHDVDLISPAMLIDGKMSPPYHAHEVALNAVNIRRVSQIAFAPDQPKFFLDLKGRTAVNSYVERGAETIPQVHWTPTDKRNVELFKRHLEITCPDPRERALFVSWLAYCVQNTGTKITWSPILQGAQGSGKSVYARIMAAVLGKLYVRDVNTSTLENRFTGWAKNTLLACIEELRIQGHNRYEVANRLKPFITNDTVETETKGVDSDNTKNYLNIIAFTNYKNCIPLEQDDRRYFPVFSSLQTTEDVNLFVRDNPRHYPDLNRASIESAGAIKGYLSTVEIHPEFEAQGNAPVSEGKGVMQALSRSDAALWLEDMLTRTKPIAGISNALLSTRVLTDWAQGPEGCDEAKFTTRFANNLVTENDFIYLGRERLVPDGVMHTLFTRDRKVVDLHKHDKKQFLTMARQLFKGVDVEEALGADFV